MVPSVQYGVSTIANEPMFLFEIIFIYFMLTIFQIGIFTKDKINK